LTIHAFSMKMVIIIMVMVSLMVIMIKLSSMYVLLNVTHFVFLLFDFVENAKRVKHEN